MSLDYYFPLLNEVLYGSLQPERAENVESADFVERIRSRVKISVQPVGVYAMSYLPAHTPKSTYYHRLLLSETYAYCVDMHACISAEKDPCIRSYLRNQILDKHLKTSLMRVGDAIKRHNYRLSELKDPYFDANADRLANCYIYHLLKVCLAKAYLEIQAELLDVVDFPLNEELLYTGYVGEVMPVQSFLVKKPKSVAEVKKPISPLEKSLVMPESTVPEEETCTIAEAASQLGVHKKTVRRKIQSGELLATKKGKMYQLDKARVDALIALRLRKR